MGTQGAHHGSTCHVPQKDHLPSSEGDGSHQGDLWVHPCEVITWVPEINGHEGGCSNADMDSIFVFFYISELNVILALFSIINSLFILCLVH